MFVDAGGSVLSGRGGQLSGTSVKSTWLSLFEKRHAKEVMKRSELNCHVQT